MINNIFNNYYKGKKVLVTGHTGFKGAWLSLWLMEMGADVIGYSLTQPTEPSLFSVLKLSDRLKHNIGDIRDFDNLNNVIVREKPEIVFHLAAQPIVRLSYEKPVETYETNIMGTVNVLEAVRINKFVKTLINITSDKCYDNREWVWGYRENDPMGGYDPYSSSKGCAELVVSAYRNSYFNIDRYGKDHNVGVASVRAGNVIGGGDWALDRLIPDCVKKITCNEEIILRNPNATRPWELVLEPLSGYLLLGAVMHDDYKKYSSGWNFGPTGEDFLSVEEVVNKVIERWNKGKYRVIEDTKLHEAILLKLDISKSNFYLKWKPVYDAYETVHETVDWYRNYYDNGIDMNSFSIGQIEKFISIAKEKQILWALK